MADLTEYSRTVIAEGLNSEQLRQALTAMIMAGTVNCIGTPSREEALAPSVDSVDGVLSVLCGFVMVGSEGLTVDATLAVAQRGPASADGHPLYDLATLSIPMAENYLGVDRAEVAQVYGAGTATPMPAETFESLLVQLGNSE